MKEADHYDHILPTSTEIESQFIPSKENCNPCFYSQDISERPFCRKLFQFNPDQCPFTGPMIESGSFLVPLSAINQAYRRRRDDSPIIRDLESHNLGPRSNPWRRTP